MLTKYTYYIFLWIILYIYNWYSIGAYWEVPIIIYYYIYYITTMSEALRRIIGRYYS